MIPISEAIQIIKDRIPILGIETIPLPDSVGRILGEDIVAKSDLPSFDRAQMDGFAVRSDDIANVPSKLKVVGESLAGKRWNGEIESGETVRIMTGAALPIGADSVQKIEVTAGTDGFVEIFESTKPGQFFVKRAAEITAGTTIFDIGEEITKTMIAVLASFGYAKIAVYRQPTISILATGNELVAFDAMPKQDQIRDSNSITLAKFAEEIAVVNEISLIGDDLSSLKTKIAACKSQIIILSGGVSMGDYDFTKPALIGVGAELFIDKVALKPGKPFVFARRGDQFIFGLPGNPASVVVTFCLFVRLAIMQMQNASNSALKPGKAILSHGVKGSNERESYLPAAFSINDSAQLIATPTRYIGSSDLVGFAKAECLVYIPVNQEYQAQDIVTILFI